ncbi:hypothetical protein [Acaryochloris sp. CCMEE 5410]|uniref:hypothetical protein n=1 Tax=Acaryochloris sp. CCMEE 5410 TaxID=310037 RepID=UPI0002483899|nr:hypothetical protein [Acaryochloris sp. CCMEE 5410]KAI9133822.1 hypothetical protein ON05_011295 [Acaryochloris sp. CCMEE 5410]
MSRDTKARLIFADFLVQLANGDADNADWAKYMVAHYNDRFLEELRRCVMRLRYYSTTEWGNREANDMLRHWANALRLSIDTPLLSFDNTHIDLHLTTSEFVVLDSMLRRFSESDDFSVSDNIEQQVLYNLQCLCEKYPAYSKLPDLATARRELLGDVHH